MDHTNTMILKNNFFNISDSHAAISLNFFAKASGLLIIVYMANSFNQNLFGRYSYLIALAGFFATFIKIGLPPYLTKITSSLLVSDRYSELISLWHLVAHYLLISFVLLLTSLFLVFYIQPFSFENIDFANIFICILIAYCIAFSEIRSSMIRGAGYIKSGLVPENFIRPCVFIFTLYLTINFSTYNISTILLLFFGSYLISNSLSQLVLLKITKQVIQPNITNDNHRFKLNSRELVSYFSFSFLQILMSQFCILLFPFFSSYDELAIYRISFSGGFLLTSILIAISSANINKFSTLYTQKNFNSLNSHANKCSAMSFKYSFFFIMLSCFSAPFVIDLILDESYMESLMPFYIIAFGQFFNCAFGLASSILQMSNYQSYNNVSLFISIFIGIIIFIFLTSKSGAIGASIAYSASLLVYILLSQFFCKIKIGFFVNPFGNISRE